MIIRIRPDTSHVLIEKLCNKLQARGILTHPYLGGENRQLIGLVGDVDTPLANEILALEWVEEVKKTGMPFKLISRDFHPKNRIIRLKNGVTFGEKNIVMIAGPCSVESRNQIMELAHKLREMGVLVLRGGAWKPRTSPYSFRGYHEEALSWLREAADRYQMAVVSELMDSSHLILFEETVDLIQIGARNMYNYSLLESVGQSSTPVMLKRAMSATLNEFLLSAEYIALAGNLNILLCERGIRSFERQTRNTLDISSVPLLQRLSSLPVVVDPSHATGRADLVAPVSKGALACGADALMIEVHACPDQALSDGEQCLRPSDYLDLLKELQLIAQAVGRTMVTT